MYRKLPFTLPLLLLGCGGNGQINIIPVPVVAGAVYHYNDAQRLVNAHIIGKPATDPNVVNTLQINGRDIALVGSGTQYDAAKRVYFQREVNRRDNSSIERILQPNLNHSYAGMIGLGSNLDANGQARSMENHLFFQGQSPRQMPTEGRALYNGSAFVIDGTDRQTSGNARFAVDFGAKTIAGQLDNQVASTHNGVRTTLNGMNFIGGIRGTSFMGQNGSAQYTGAFYGDQAAELAGVVRDEQRGFHGFYGARR